jgi:hypothetical protein
VSNYAWPQKMESCAGLVKGARLDAAVGPNNAAFCCENRLCLTKGHWRVPASQGNARTFRAFVVSGFRDLGTLAAFDATRLLLIRAVRLEHENPKVRKPEMDRRHAAQHTSADSYGPNPVHPPWRMPLSGQQTERALRAGKPLHVLLPAGFGFVLSSRWVCFEKRCGRVSVHRKVA